MTDDDPETTAGGQAHEGGQSPEDRLPVYIPARVGTAIERRLPRTEFDSTDEYVSFVLESLLRELDRWDGGPRDEPATSDHGGRIAASDSSASPGASEDSERAAASEDSERATASEDSERSSELRDHLESLGYL